jgi:hypothetical protein
MAVHLHRVLRGGLNQLVVTVGGYRDGASGFARKLPAIDESAAHLLLRCAHFSGAGDPPAE